MWEEKTTFTSVLKKKKVLFFFSCELNRQNTNPCVYTRGSAKEHTKNPTPSTCYPLLLHDNL